MKVALPIFAGIGLGVGVAFLALLMSGGGHGWNSAFISSVSIVGAPLAMLAWSLRQQRLGFFLAPTAVLGAVLVDVYLWRETVSHEVEYVEKVWNAMPGAVLLWAALFASWQLLAVIVLLKGISKRGVN